ncbi:unnamed protein product [Callosobruchus maculatus]|uniref:O-acyltransferase WSD1 C-terminal domain-containing protein n=1 Tax=Callosobruchus maculatus TaxID=64391 RepID=A0A653BJG0_CALMS|nr:unnamed protein product [Callosobruchus maculatus]
MTSKHSSLTGPKCVIPTEIAKNESLAILLFFITLILLVIAAPILIILAILRTSASVILKLKHGKNFGGLVESDAVMWKMPDITNQLIHILTIQQSKISTPEAFLEHLKQSLYRPLSKSNAQKLTSVSKFFLGYAYCLSNQVTIGEICKIITVDSKKEFIDESDLSDILSDLVSKPMPKDNTGLFEILVVQKPLKQIEPDTYQYALIVRLHHVVADGISLTNYLMKTFADDQEALACDLKDLIAKFDTSKTKKVEKTGWEKVTQIAKEINTFMVHFPTVFVNQVFLQDRNCFHGPKLTGKKFAVYAIEKEGEDLMETVRQIKGRVTGSTFSSVVLTAISRTVGRHMQKRQEDTPSFLSVLITALFSVPDMTKAPILTNNFSVAVLSLPLFEKSGDAYWQIGLVDKYWNGIKERPDFLVNYMMFKHLIGLIPVPILAQILRADKVTMSISNVPGMPKVHVLGGQIMEKLVFFTPHRDTAGVGFTITTYDNKFQMGLMIDKVFNCSKEEAQSLVDGVLTEIRRMHDELGLAYQKKKVVD